MTSASAAGLRPEEFEQLRRVIHSATGISLHANKQELVAGRLGPRMRALGLATFTDYLRAVSADTSGGELRELINRITTNKTSFFREPHHFEFIKQTVVPELLERARKGGRRRIRVWSAGCSTGQEPWSIAMTLAEALGSLDGWDIRILASDLDTEVLAKAENAIYDDVAIGDLPVPLRNRFLEPSGEGRRIAASLRGLVTFRRINLAAPSTWQVRTQFDLILCRNTAIYFDRETQEALFKGLASHLEPTGYFMSGHSENLHWISHVLRPIGNTIHVLAARPKSVAPRSRRAKSVAPGSTRAKSVAPRSRRAKSVAPVQRAESAAVVARVARPAMATPARRIAAAAHGVRQVAAEKNKQEIYIQAGGVQASAQGAMIRTTLGSCVAACLYDPEARIGGMNHFLLPEDHGGSRLPTSFGVHAMEVLINAMMKLGGDRRRFVAKLFGAAEQFTSGAPNHVGKQNADFARQFLIDEGIPLLAEKLGGPAALSVLFDTGDGRAFVATLGKNQEVARAEAKERAHLEEQRPVEESIVFFGAP